MTGSLSPKADAQAVTVTLDAPGERNAVRMARRGESRQVLGSNVEDASICCVIARGMESTRDELDDSFAFPASNDYREGVASFLARRPPRVTGK